MNTYNNLAIRLSGLRSGRPSDFRQVVTASFPIVAEGVLRILLGNVDQLMLNSYSPTAMPAVGNANQIMNMAIMILDMICTATVIIMAQYIGAGDKVKTNEFSHLSFLMILILGAVLSVLLVVFRNPIFNVIHIPDNLRADAETYLVVVGGSLIFQGIFMGASAVLKSFMHMQDIMFGSAIMNVLNIALNFCLINGYGPFPRLGVLGAAIATAIGRAAGAAYLIAAVRKKTGISLISRGSGRPPLESVKMLFVVGLPAAGDSISYNCMQFVLLALINTFGTMVVQAKVYMSSILPFVYIFTSSLAVSTQIKVGYYVGARKPEKAKPLVLKSSVLAVFVSLTLSFLLLRNSDLVFGIFTHDPEVLDLIASVLVIDFFLEFGRAVNIILIHALLSSGDTKYPLYCALLSMWGIGVTTSFLFGNALNMGLRGVWIGMALDEWCRALAFLVRWKKGTWMTKRLTR